MIKKRTAQTGAPGRRKTTSGYVINTRPGPELTTESMLVFVEWAIVPRIANCS